MFYKSSLLAIGVASLLAIGFGVFGGAIGLSERGEAAELFKIAQASCPAFSPKKLPQAFNDPAWSQANVDRKINEDIIDRVDGKIKEDVVSSVAFSPSNGEFLASGNIYWLTDGSVDGTVKIWKGLGSPERSPERTPISRIRTGIRSVAFSSDGRFLAAGGVDGSILLWNFQQWRSGSAIKPTQLPRTQKESMSIAFSPDGRWLASGGISPGGVRVIMRWDLRAGEFKDYISGDQVYSVAFSPDSKVIAGTSKNTVALWNAATGRKICTVGNSPDGHRSSINAIAFSPDGTILASGGTDGTIKLWSLQSFQLLHSLEKGHTGRINSISFSPSGRFLVTGGSDGLVNLWQVGVSQPIYQDKNPKDVVSVAFHPNGTAFATGSKDKLIRIYRYKQ
jgi:WD40 repeat protein